MPGFKPPARLPVTSLEKSRRFRKGLRCRQTSLRASTFADRKTQARRESSGCSDCTGRGSAGGASGRQPDAMGPPSQHVSRIMPQARQRSFARISCVSPPRFFREFRGTGRSFRGCRRRRLPGWTHSPRTMPGFWASTTPGESMLLTFDSMSGESKSSSPTSARAFPARNAASPAGLPITRKNGAGGTSTRCSSRPSWSLGCRGAAARTME